MDNAKRIYLAQIISSILSVVRLFLILSFFGVDSLGIYSLFFAAVTFLSLPGQILNNQAFQILFIQKYRLLRNVVISSSLIAFMYWMMFVTFILCIVSLFFSNIVDFEQGGWESLLFISVVSVLLVHVFDLLSIVKGRLENYYIGLAINSISNIVLILILYFVLHDDSLLFLPFISSMIVLLYYAFTCKDDFFQVFKRRNRRKSHKFRGVFFLLGLLKRTWYINTLPFVTTLLDFGIKFILASLSSVTVVGFYQIIISVESVIGNVFLGPFYRHIIYKFALKQYEITRSIIIRLAAKSVLLTLIPAFGLLMLGYINYIFEYNSDFTQVFWILFSVSLVRVLWSVWGVFAQVLLSQGHVLLITHYEIWSRFLVSFFFIVGTLFINDNLWVYVLASLAVGLLLITSSLYHFLKLES